MHVVCCVCSLQINDDDDLVKHYITHNGKSHPAAVQTALSLTSGFRKLRGEHYETNPCINVVQKTPEANDIRFKTDGSGMTMVSNYNSVITILLLQFCRYLCHSG